MFIRGSNAEFAEKHVTQFGAVVLPRVNEQVITVSVKLRDDPRQSNNFWSRSDDCKNFKQVAVVRMPAGEVS